MRCIFNRLSRAQRPCCCKTEIAENETSLFKLHSVLHKLKAIDFALHTSHIENLLRNVLECQKTMLDTETRVCSNIWGDWTRIEQSTLKPSALCDSLRPLSHFPLCPKYSLPRPPQWLPSHFSFCLSLPLWSMFSQRSRKSTILILIWWLGSTAKNSRVWMDWKT